MSTRGKNSNFAGHERMITQKRRPGYIIMSLDVYKFTNLTKSTIADKLTWKLVGKQRKM
jgi:hypothetical protein